MGRNCLNLALEIADFSDKDAYGYFTPNPAWVNCRQICTIASNTLVSHEFCSFCKKRDDDRIKVVCPIRSEHGLFRLAGLETFQLAQTYLKITATSDC